MSTSLNVAFTAPPRWVAYPHDRGPSNTPGRILKIRDLRDARFFPSVSAMPQTGVNIPLENFWCVYGEITSIFPKDPKYFPHQNDAAGSAEGAASEVWGCAAHDGVNTSFDVDVSWAMGWQNHLTPGTDPGDVLEVACTVIVAWPTAKMRDLRQLTIMIADLWQICVLPFNLGVVLKMNDEIVQYGPLYVDEPYTGQQKRMCHGCDRLGNPWDLTPIHGSPFWVCNHNARRFAFCDALSIRKERRTVEAYWRCRNIAFLHTHAWAL